MQHIRHTGPASISCKPVRRRVQHTCRTRANQQRRNTTCRLLARWTWMFARCWVHSSYTGLVPPVHNLQVLV
eukprot:3701600-Alexandrium_andersonii.AAC.1